MLQNLWPPDRADVTVLRRAKLADRLTLNTRARQYPAAPAQARTPTRADTCDGGLVSNICELPPDVFGHICEHLPIDAVAQGLQTNRIFYGALTSPKAMHRAVQQRTRQTILPDTSRSVLADAMSRHRQCLHNIAANRYEIERAPYFHVRDMQDDDAGELHLLAQRPGLFVASSQSGAVHASNRAALTPQTLRPRLHGPSQLVAFAEGTPGEARQLTLWHAPSNQLRANVADLGHAGPTSHQQPLHADFSQAGDRVAFCSASPSYVGIVDTIAGVSVARWPIAAPPTALTLHDDGTSLVTARPGVVELWDVRAHVGLVATIPLAAQAIHHMAAGRDNHRQWVSSEAGLFQTSWRTHRSSLLDATPHERTACSFGGDLLARQTWDTGTAAPTALRLHIDGVDRHELRGNLGWLTRPMDMHFSSDGTRLYAFDDTAYIYHLAGRPRRSTL